MSFAWARIADTGVGRHAAVAHLRACPVAARAASALRTTLRSLPIFRESGHVDVLRCR